MINNFLRLTLITYIWRKYKILIISTLLLLSYFWVVGKLHDDFIALSQLKKETQNLGLSFLLKWLAFLIGVIIYVFTNTWLKKPHTRDGRNFFKSNPSNHQSNSSGSGKALLRQPSQDPFSLIRQRKKLRSEGDFIIEKSAKKHKNEKR